MTELTVVSTHVNEYLFLDFSDMDPDEPGYDVAEFLVFTQHIQYAKKGSLAYISDYQGRLLNRYEANVL